MENWAPSPGRQGGRPIDIISGNKPRPHSSACPALATALPAHFSLSTAPSGNISAPRGFGTGPGQAASTQMFSGSHSSSKHFAKCPWWILTAIAGQYPLPPPDEERGPGGQGDLFRAAQASSQLTSVAFWILGKKNTINTAFGIDSPGFKSHLLTVWS